MHIPKFILIILTILVQPLFNQVMSAESDPDVQEEGGTCRL